MSLMLRKTCASLGRRHKQVFITHFTRTMKDSDFGIRRRSSKYLGLNWKYLTKYLYIARQNVEAPGSKSDAASSGVKDTITSTQRFPLKCQTRRMLERRIQSNTCCRKLLKRRTGTNPSRKSIYMSTCHSQSLLPFGQSMQRSFNHWLMSSGERNSTGRSGAKLPSEETRERPCFVTMDSLMIFFRNLCPSCVISSKLTATK